ncbi:8120_t:CDS:2 [Diversispora eburnea]|uniref:8120_t:CDS:1 n=1 Tax=Diversispora eburnea TaxID=1213867 RepID=A0A9N8ZBE1_9GLOM|nr:8120_t:CDS:2 [Diversispora eburnea]
MSCSSNSFRAYRNLLQFQPILGYRPNGRQFSQTIFLPSRFSNLINKIQESYPIDDITPKELHSLLNPESPSKKSPIIIDVREKDEQERGIIPTAIPLPRGILERDVERKVVSVDEINSAENGRNLVVYCAGAESLIRLGYKKENVKNLKGGYDNWKEDGFEVEDYETRKRG